MSTRIASLPDRALVRVSGPDAKTFLNGLLELNGYLACRELTLADLAAAAHLSAYDYFGDVEWNAVPELKDWYARIKSRPSFRPLLADRLEAVRPVAHYTDLDF